jgi:hypothetical protein
MNYCFFFSLSDVTPIPWKKLLSLCIIATAETINYSSIYPYINFMVKDFGVVDDERKLGYIFNSNKCLLFLLFVLFRV